MHNEGDLSGDTGSDCGKRTVQWHERIAHEAFRWIGVVAVFLALAVIVWSAKR